MPKATLRPYTPLEEKIVHWVTKIGGGEINTRVYRLTGGRLMGTFPGGQKILLLTTTGRKSGLPRTSPLLYMRDGDDLVIVASKGGVSEHPAWFNNLVAHPDVTVEVGSSRFQATARVADAKRRSALWPRLVEYYPSYATYQSRTEREIPVILLTKK